MDTKELNTTVEAGISRRQLLGMAGVAGAGIVLAGTLGGCGSNKTI